MERWRCQKIACPKYKMPADDHEATVVIALAVMRVPVRTRGRAGAPRHGEVTRSRAGGQLCMIVETRDNGTAYRGARM
ncbi:hypothetical protein MRX96_016038 [Rhipicephalus microplus]